MLHIFHGFSLSYLPSFLTPPWLQSYQLLHWLQTTASGASGGGQVLPTPAQKLSWLSLDSSHSGESLRESATWTAQLSFTTLLK